MQTSNSRYVECSPESAVGKLPPQASALFVGGQKQLAVALSIAELLLGKLTAEETVTARFKGRRIVALCSCAGAECNEQQQMSEVMHAHHCAFEGPSLDGQAFAVSQFSQH
jgi:hypothetical protein